LVFGSEREYAMADGGRYIVVAVPMMEELAVFPGIHGWACHVPWAKVPMKEVFVTHEMEELAPDGPCRVAGAFLLG
jgi:hypothetical protein